LTKGSWLFLFAFHACKRIYRHGMRAKKKEIIRSSCGCLSNKGQLDLGGVLPYAWRCNIGEKGRKITADRLVVSRVVRLTVGLTTVVRNFYAASSVF